MKRIAIIGGGTAGVAAAYELASSRRHHGGEIKVTLFEASSRLGGIVETIREGGFVIEGGPDGWVTEKPWARELAVELGLEDELLPSSDEGRRTYVLVDGVLKPVPDGMRMMVPTDLAALDATTLFSDTARAAFHDEVNRAEELKAAAPDHDESVAAFVERHFGNEVLVKIGAPLLSGVLGGDVSKLSVRAVMAPFVAMEREHGSLIEALRAKVGSGKKSSIFTSLRSGLGTLIDRMVAAIPPTWVRLGTKVTALERDKSGWQISFSVSHGPTETEHFDTVLLATPVHVASELLTPLDAEIKPLMPEEASSAVVVGFGFEDGKQITLPPGFGFLVPPGSAENTLLMACTFMHQKYAGRIPKGGCLLRAFFGGHAAERLMRCGNDEIAAVARLELARILGPLPEPRVTVVRRLPLSLPQYAVGHLERMAELERRIDTIGNLVLLGNGYRGVGLPDLIRDSRNAARALTTQTVQ
ncbi:MAG: protoporphyrinogen oxidase [Edaphobacter sp.]|uniref:protoporphyrinogen oxidase n=1 Tax=Edaphobacter sp. TaxID=1934404 RepID=UPI0023972A54|nr:protoporphyrinogen oxidase [Edaphobacter sp.]MDE1175743.1 protoporphyrinogen oxidase [Edaphobacter sp.]